MPSLPRPAPLRLFLDAGIFIDGFFNRWGTCKGVLILTTLRTHFRAVMADPIADECARALRAKTANLPIEEAQTIRDGVDGWTKIARPKQAPWPSDAEMLAHAGLLSAVRHRNDMPSVVAAVLERPDWVLSTNTDHWNQDLAARTGLRVATPLDFLLSLQPS